MAGYPKIWTSLLSEEWFAPLSLNAKGLYLWLILEAKRQGDTGRIISTGCASLAQQVVADRSTVANILRKFQQMGKIKLDESKTRLLIIELCNYRKYQELANYHANSGRAENSAPAKHKPDQTNNQTNNQGNSANSSLSDTDPNAPKRPAVGGLKKCKKCGQWVNAIMDGRCFQCAGLDIGKKVDNDKGN